MSPLAPPSGGICDKFKELTPEAKRNAYRRFYKALSAHWVAIEFSWLMKIREYDTRADQHTFVSEVGAMWAGNSSRPMQEKLDIVEVVDFVWVFLPHKIFHSPTHVLEWFDSIERPLDPDWCYIRSLDQAHVGPSQYDNIPQLLCGPRLRRDISKSFQTQIAQFLRPTHIIELLLLSAWNPQQSWKIDRFEYLRRTGFADTNFGVVLQSEQDGLLRMGTRFTTDVPGYDLVDDFSRMGYLEQCEQLQGEIRLGRLTSDCEIDEIAVADDCMKQWEGYRSRKHWSEDRRGRILFTDETPEEMYESCFVFDTLHVIGEEDYPFYW